MTNTAITANKFTHAEIMSEVGGTVDNARALGFIAACLGCGTTTQIDPTAPLLNHPTVEAARVATRDAILAVAEDAFECCPDSDSILF